MKIQILSEAKTDLILGYNFYESQCEGLGEYFLDSLYSDIESLKLYAGIHQKFYGLFRLLSKRFPFAIYYALDDNIVKIYAVLDCRQDSAKISDRLN